MKRFILSVALLAAPLSAQVQNGPRMGLDGSIHSPSSSYSINGASGAATFSSGAFGALSSTGAASVGSLTSTGAGSFGSVSASGAATVGSLTLTGAGAGASLYKQLPGQCTNILAYGGDRTGVTDSSPAFAAAVAASTSGKVCIYAPSGTYLFASTPTITLPTALLGSATIKGDGIDNTIFKMASGVAGPTISLNGTNQNFHIHDLTVAASVSEASTNGITVQQTVAGSSSAHSDIQNVSVRGIDGYNVADQFFNGIYLNGTSNVNMLNVHTVGGWGAGYATGSRSGLYLTGDANHIPVQINIAQSEFNYTGFGIYYGPYVQGVAITESNFVGGNIGVYQPLYSPVTASYNDQLAIVGSQFNDAGQCLYLNAQMDDITITGNTFYIDSNSGSAIQFANVGAFSITGNTLIGLVSGANGIVISTYNIDSGLITANQFKSFTTAIWLQSASKNVNVQSNSYSANTTNVLNQGTNNVVGGGSQ